MNSVILKSDIFENEESSVAQQILQPAQLSLIKPPATFRPSDFVTGKGKPSFTTDWGALYSADCLDVLPRIKSESVDTIFADPPFNLQKLYGSKVSDDLAEHEYVEWCYKWIAECERIVKPGGAIFIYNLPKWNMLLGAELTRLGLNFRHWIAVSIKFGLPITGRLYPSHYSLLYFTKGKPKTFRKIRTPIELCRHCDREVKDYGGHRDAMNPLGVNLTDVWVDVPPVRHKKFKSEKRSANQLSTKILDRVIELTTNQYDVVLDPFGGAGTTFAVAERKMRHWIGCEIEPEYSEVIQDRLLNKDIGHHHNDDVIEG
jgi:site-specific DNA-methyltransferase (adenine-specific)